MKIILEPPSVQLLCIWRKSNVVPEPQQRFTLLIGTEGGKETTLNYFHLNYLSSAKKNSMFLSEHHNNPIRIIFRQSELDWINQFSEENEAEPHPAAAETRGSLWTKSTSGGAGNPTGLLSMRLNLKVWRHVKVFQRARPLSISVNYFKKIVFPNSPVSDYLMFVHSNKLKGYSSKREKKHLEWKMLWWGFHSNPHEVS